MSLQMTKEEKRMTGTITYINKDAGYGFIQAEGKNYFFHASDVEDYSFDNLKKGDELMFAPDENERGLIAKNVIFFHIKDESILGFESGSTQE